MSKLCKSALKTNSKVLFCYTVYCVIFLKQNKHKVYELRDKVSMFFCKIIIVYEQHQIKTKKRKEFKLYCVLWFI